MAAGFLLNRCEICRGRFWKDAHLRRFFKKELLRGAGGGSGTREEFCKGLEKRYR
jgi:hypothetical protein